MGLVQSLLQEISEGYRISRQEALNLASEQLNIYDLMHAANKLRENFFGNEIKFCSIINAKSGICSNDCKFCAQSSRYNTDIATYPLIPAETTIAAAEDAARSRASSFGIVTSGMKISSDGEFNSILQTIAEITAKNRIRICASLGELDEDKAEKLKKAGLNRYHHNLETSKTFYSQICSTYDYNKKIRTIRIAKKTGFEICCGGIFGLGEQWEDRIDMAMLIRDLHPDSIPINFLRPVKGTPLENMKPLAPLEALRIIAIYRFIFPDTTIKVAGGREYVLRDLQSWMFYAGANGAILGNYLTTLGRPAEEDLEMIRSLGLKLKKEKA